MRNVIKVCFLGLLGLSLLFGDNSEQLLQEGKTLLEQGQLQLAEQKLLSALEEDPKKAETFFLLSEVNKKQYDLDKSRDHLRTAIELDQRNQVYRDEFEIVNRIASLLSDAKRSIDGGNIDAGIAKYENMVNEFPEFSAMAFYNIGLAYLRDESVSEAARFFRSAIDEDPSYDKPGKALKGIAEKIFNEGNQSVRRGDYEGANDSYKNVLELDPNYYRAYYQLGFVSTRLGEYDQAISHYEKAVSIEPLYARGWFALALTHQRNGDFEKALECLDKATDADPAYARAYSQKGTIYLRQGDYDSAEKAYNMAIQADPTYAKPYEDLGKLFISQKRYNEVLNSLMTATALDAKSPTAWYMLAQCQNILEQCESAKESALTALDVKTNYPPALYELGLAEACLGNKTAALNAFEKARRDRNWRKAAEYEIDKIQNPEKYQNR